MDKDQPEHELYIFGVYFCVCNTLVIWYPDIKKDPNTNYFPESIECPTCKKQIPPNEKKMINPERDLVNEFVQITSTYNFEHLLMIDESHVHLVWNRPKKMD